jgi:hypothetical protein
MSTQPDAATAPPREWTEAALQDLNGLSAEEYAAVKKAILHLASRFTTSGIPTDNVNFINAMAAVKDLEKLNAVIAGLVVLLQYRADGMTAQDASEKLVEIVRSASAPPAPGPPAARTAGDARFDAEDAADDAESEASQARVGVSDEDAKRAAGAPPTDRTATPGKFGAALHPSLPSVLKF